MVNTLISDVERLNQMWGDEESRIIFQANIMYRLFGDVSAYEKSNQYIFQRRQAKNILDLLKKNKGTLALFGASVAGEVTLDLLNALGIQASYFVDNDSKKWGNQLRGLHIRDPKCLQDNTQFEYVLVTPSSSRFCEEIIEQLLDMGVSQNKILCPYKVFGKMYCEQEILDITENDVLVDGGCYDGTSSYDIDSIPVNGIKKIYAFEPDENHFERCRKYFKDNQKVELIKKGLYDANGVCSFMSQDGEGSLICDGGTEKIDICKIDTLASDATFIKMDIEGAELKALEGAKETIIKNRPKLAISIYHNSEDILQIPLWLKEIVPEYRLYLRQYTMSYLECVLYATI